MALNPYDPLEVIETYSRSDGKRWWVRDDEIAHLFNLVEYVDRRLTCYCDQGQAHTEAVDTEPPCVHLRAVVDHRMATNAAAGPPLGVLRPALFCD